MCRIWGISYGPDGPEGESVDPVALARHFFTELAGGGAHAYGWGYFDAASNTINTYNNSGRADLALAQQAMSKIPDNPEWLIGHTRFATHGSEHDYRNNHPVWHHDVVGIHNGMISNYAQIFQRYSREDSDTKVDTEAIFASVYHLGDREGLAALAGSAAVAYTRISDPETLVLARTYGSPLWVATTQAGSVVFSSEFAAINDSGLDIVDCEYIRENGVFAYLCKGELGEWRVFHDDLHAGIRSGTTYPANWLAWEDDLDEDFFYAEVMRRYTSRTLEGYDDLDADTPPLPGWASVDEAEPEEHRLGTNHTQATLDRVDELLNEMMVAQEGVVDIDPSDSSDPNAGDSQLPEDL